MKIKTLLLVTVISLSYQQTNATEIVDQGKQLFTNYCSACHGVSNGGGKSNRLAPPIIAVKKHYIDTYSDEQSFVKAVANWVTKPDESKTLMRGAIRRFKIMPPMPFPRADLEKIASYIFKGDIEKPKGFDKHFKEEHKKGRGKKLN